MDVIEPNFQIDVNSELEYIEFGNLARQVWDALSINWAKKGMAGETSDNWIEITKNPRYNPAFLELDNGWFYYRYFVTVAYKHKSIRDPSEIEKQISFARSLKHGLVKGKCRVKVHAEFENLL